jgi:pachytene checkpoint protein 2
LEACEVILSDTINAMGEKWPDIKKLISDKDYISVVRDSVGLDGRQIRKAVLSACTSKIDTVLNPGQLTMEQLKKSIHNAKTRSK